MAVLALHANDIAAIAAVLLLWAAGLGVRRWARRRTRRPPRPSD